MSYRKVLSTAVLIVLLAVIGLTLQAQESSRGFNYQAVARDGEGVILRDTYLEIELSIYAESVDDQLLWQEVHEVETNAYGLFNLVIGEGESTNQGIASGFDAIDWQGGVRLLGVRIDGGNGMVDMGAVKFQSVPYSKVSAYSEQSGDSEWLEALILLNEEQIDLLSEQLDIDLANLLELIEANQEMLDIHESLIADNLDTLLQHASELNIHANQIAALEQALLDLEDVDSILLNQIETNESNIQDNTISISSNTSSIETNATNIATNTSNISINASDIENLSLELDSDSAFLHGLISDNAANISTNTTNISTNTSAISANTTAINIHSNQISANESNISANEAAIQENADDIVSNTLVIQANTIGINNNASDINANEIAITINANDIAINESEIENNADNIDALSAELDSDSAFLHDLIQNNAQGIDSMNQIGMIILNELDSDSAFLHGLINDNASDISANTSDISTLYSLGLDLSNELDSDSAFLHGLINDNESDISDLSLEQDADSAFLHGLINALDNTMLVDADDDTKIQVEESADEDMIRFDVGGTEAMVIDADGHVEMDNNLGVEGELHVLEYSHFYDTTLFYNVIGVMGGVYAGGDSYFDSYVEINDDLDVGDDLDVDGDVELGDGLSDDVHINGEIQNSSLVFEGATDNNNELTLAIPDVGTDVTLTLPATEGNSGEALITDGNGVMSWGSMDQVGIQDADDDTKIQVEESPDEDIIRFDVEGEEMVTINDEGIGIGTDDASEALHISGSDADMQLDVYSSWDNPSIEFTRAQGTDSLPESVEEGDIGGKIESKFYDGSDYADGGQIIFRVDGEPGIGDMPTSLEFYTTPDGEEDEELQMVIKNTGRVGIGTEFPEEMLDVANEGDADIQSTSYSLSSIANFIGRRAQGTQDSPEVVEDGDGLMILDFKGYDGDEFLTGASIRGYVDGGATNDSLPTRLEFYVRDGYDLNSVFRIEPNGDAEFDEDVWVGDDLSIDDELTVEGSSSLEGDVYLGSDSSNTVKIRGDELMFEGTIDDSHEYYLYIPELSDDISLMLPETEGDSGQVLVTDGSGVTSWGSMAQVGIQDIDNDTKIQVEESTDEDIIRFDVAGTERWIMTESRIEPSNSGSSVFIGESAGVNDNLMDNENIGIGYESLYSNIDGGQNIALGSYSLYYNEDGSNNIALGTSALESNTSGYQNISLGYESLFSNIDGDENVALGSYSLYYNEDGSYNIALGTSALEENTSGDENVSLGYESLYSNIDGSNNIALGTYSLYSNTTGNGNIGIGYDALESNSLGNGNVAIGDLTLTTNVEGSYNTAIGHSANVATDSLANATAIGYNAQVNASNTIQLGNNSVTSVSTSGQFTSGAITYPNVDGTTGQVLTTNGVGEASWTTIDVDDDEMEIADTDADTKIQVEESPDEDIIRFDVGGMEALIIDDQGRVGLGKDPEEILDIESEDADMWLTTVTDSLNENSTMRFRRAGGSPGSPTVIPNDESMGEIKFLGYDGAEYLTGARIEAVLDDVPSVGDMPGRLVFKTYNDGSSITAMTIDSYGDITVEEDLDVEDDLDVSDELIVDGDVTLGSSNNDYVSINGTITGDSLHFEGGTYDGNELSLVIPSLSSDVHLTLPSDEGSAGEVLTTDGNGVMSWSNIGGGSGLSSLNGETGSTQTFATGTSGSGFNISSSGDVHTFNIPDASASATGLINTGAQTIAGAKTFSDWFKVENWLQVHNNHIVLTNDDNDAPQLRFQEPSGTGTQYVSFQAPNLSANTNYVLPVADGTSGQVLTTDGSANLSWSSTGSSSSWSTWTPTISHSGTANYARYKTADANEVHFELKISISSYSSGIVTFTLPETPANDVTFFIRSELNSSTNHLGYSYVSSGSTMAINDPNYTFGDGLVIYVSGSYEY